MKIKLQEALDLIQAADVVKLLDFDDYIRPQVYTEGINGEHDNEVMFVTWEEDNQEFSIKVSESENNEVERDGHKLTFIDTDGQPFELHLFREVPIIP